MSIKMLEFGGWRPKVNTENYLFCLKPKTSNLKQFYAMPSALCVFVNGNTAKPQHHSIAQFLNAMRYALCAMPEVTR